VSPSIQGKWKPENSKRRMNSTTQKSRFFDVCRPNDTNYALVAAMPQHLRRGTFQGTVRDGAGSPWGFDVWHARHFGAPGDLTTLHPPGT